MTHLAQEAPGLVVMLEQAGRTIATLERRVDQLVEEVAAEQVERRRLEVLLAQAIAETPDTAGVRPQQHTPGETVKHDPAPDDTRPPA